MKKKMMKGVFVAVAMCMSLGAFAQGQATKESGRTSGTINGHEYVDLGLPSGLKWATCNVGASSPEDYGNYYAWGETETKGAYEESNSTTFDKILSELRSAGIIGNNRQLTTSYDAARASWGGSWRMPTEAEYEELWYKCTWIWTTRGGTNGYKVMGLNGRSIFIPAAGCRDGASLYYDGTDGGYWSSTAADNGLGAYGFRFGGGYRYMLSPHRYFGMPVRPVSE